MAIKTIFFALLLVIGYVSANAQDKEDPELGEPIDPEPIDLGFDLIEVSSLVSKSEMVILGNVKAISNIRRVADRVVPGPWILTQYFVEVEDVILSSTGSVPDSISFVSYGGDLVLPAKLSDEGGNWPYAASSSDLAGYKAIFHRFGESQSLSHSARISQTGKYLIFIQSTRKQHLFEGLRLLRAYQVREVNGIDVVRMHSSAEYKMVDYSNLASSLSSGFSASLDSFDFEPDRSSKGTLHIAR
ncbi:MAG: hypothetical protein WD397_12010 [Wenzhouxiangellaceae bacterium]